MFLTCGKLPGLLQRRMSGCCRRSCDNDTQMRLIVSRSQGNPMPLPQPSSSGVLKHTRAVIVEAFARDDGLWNLDAPITDIKTHDAKLASSIRAAGISCTSLLCASRLTRSLKSPMPVYRPVQCSIRAAATRFSPPTRNSTVLTRPLSCLAHRWHGRHEVFPRWAIQAVGQE